MEPSQRASLRTLHSSELESLRAGAPAILPVLQDNERSALRFAESRSRDLATLRAGLSDREWTLVVVGIAVIILLIAIS